MSYAVSPAVKCLYNCLDAELRAPCVPLARMAEASDPVAGRLASCRVTSTDSMQQTERSLPTHLWVPCLCRFESSSVVLARMAEAVDVLVSSGRETGRVACRVMYRLAHHADTLYQGIVLQKQSPEWSTAQAVIKQKRQQVHLLHSWSMAQGLLPWSGSCSHTSLPWQLGRQQP